MSSKDPRPIKKTSDMCCAVSVLSSASTYQTSGCSIHDKTYVVRGECRHGMSLKLCADNMAVNFMPGFKRPVPD